PRSRRRGERDQPHPPDQDHHPTGTLPVSAGPPRRGTEAGDRQVREAGGAEYELEPITGRTHQLRVHMNALGLPILGDPVYPVDLAPDPYDFSSPLQLVAAEVAFADPQTGRPRRFTTQLSLD